MSDRVTLTLSFAIFIAILGLSFSEFLNVKYESQSASAIQAIKEQYSILYKNKKSDGRTDINKSAYDLAVREWQKRGSVSCNPDEAYNFIMSRDSGGRNHGLALKVKPTLNPQTHMFVDGLDPELACRIASLMKADPKIRIIYGYRSVADQTAICGSSGKTRGCAAPGRSCHQRGLAADLSFPKEYSRAYRQSLLSKFKLHLAYSSNGHVQCIEHPRASVSSCNFPCAKGGPTIDPNGSGPTGGQYVQNPSDPLSSFQGGALRPSYGGDTLSYADQSDYNYLPSESWEGVEPQSELQDNTDDWWNDYLGEDYAGYDGTSEASVFGESTSALPNDSYTPILGYEGESKGERNDKSTNNTDVQESSTGPQTPRLSRSAGDSVPKEVAFIKALEPKDSILDYFIVKNNSYGTQSQTKNRSLIGSFISGSPFNWFINDDVRQSQRGVDQDVYNSWLRDGTAPQGSEFIQNLPANTLEAQSNAQQSNTQRANTSVLQKVAPVFDISTFFVFPTLPVFGI